MGFFDLFRKKTDSIEENTTVDTPKWLPTLEIESDACALPKSILDIVVGETNYINVINIINNYRLKAKILNSGNVQIDIESQLLNVEWQYVTFTFTDNVVSQIGFTIVGKNKAQLQESFNKVKAYLEDNFQNFDISFSGTDAMFVRNHYAKCKENISYLLHLLKVLNDYHLTFNIDIFQKDIAEAPTNIVFTIEEEKKLLDSVFGVGVAEKELAKRKEEAIRREEMNALYKANGITKPFDYVGVISQTAFIQIFRSHRKLKDGNIFYPLSDIKGCQMVDNPSIIRGKTTTFTETKSSNGNVIKRAVIGGIIAGGVGAVIGGTTGKTQSTSTTISQEPDTIKHDYTVIITLSNFKQLEIKFGDKLTEATKFTNLIQSSL